MRRTLVALLVVLGGALAAPAAEGDRLQRAKTLYFDRQYAAAREAWAAVLKDAPGAEATTAAYWVARCSENLGEPERALREYGAFLARRPADAVLAEEARTSRVTLAARLFKAGQRQHQAVLEQALADPSKTVRYYAALQSGPLSPELGRAAVPVLKAIVSSEADADLVDRARIVLLRVDPGALGNVGAPSPAAGSRGQASWVRVRIYEKGGREPRVSVNLPVALAEVLFKSLPDQAREDLRQKGYDADNFWTRLKALGPTEIVTVEGDDGGRIQIWLE